MYLLIILKIFLKKLSPNGIALMSWYFYKGNNGEYPLHYAVTKEMVQLLVEGGADVNSQRNGDKWYRSRDCF